jgi:preprotein translocase subunit Sss1
LGKGWFQIASFFTLTSAVLLLFQKPHTAEFIITVTSLVIGSLFMGMIIVIVRRGSR